MKVFQYRLNSLFVVITAVALALTLWLASGAIFSVLLLATLLLIPAFVAGIIYGQNDDRAFSIGGASATLVALYLMQEGFPRGSVTGTLIWPMIWVWIALSGWVSMKVRSALLKRREPLRPREKD